MSSRRAVAGSGPTRRLHRSALIATWACLAALGQAGCTPQAAGEHVPSDTTAAPPQPATAQPRVTMAGFDITSAMTLPATSPAAGPPPADPACTKGDPRRCVVAAGEPGKPVVLLMGDSHASMLVPAMRAAARRDGFTLALAALPGCPWQIGLGFKGSNLAACTAAKDVWYGTVVATLRPSVVIVATRATDHRVGGSEAVVATDHTLSGAQSQLLVAAAKRTVARLVDAGAKVIVIEPVPVSEVHSLSCLKTATYADQCDFVADDYVSPAEAGYRAFARVWPHRVASVSIDSIECPRLPVCDAVIGGSVVRKDHDHLTDRFSADISVQLEAALRATGLL